MLVLFSTFFILQVGNKCDLECKFDQSTNPLASRKITTAEGKALADQLGIPFLEASAKTRVNVEEAFLEVGKQIRKSMAAKSNSGKAKVNKKKQIPFSFCYICNSIHIDFTKKACFPD